MGTDMVEDKLGGLGSRARGVRDRLAARRALDGELISVAHLVRRPVVDSLGTRIGRVSDIVVRWKTGATHPPVVNILIRAGKGSLAISARDAEIKQTGVALIAPEFAVATRVRREGGVVLVRDVLDHQLVDVGGVQVVRAADVYLAKVAGGWELAGIDVGARALARRVLPVRPRQCPPPARAIDWADLQAFVPRFAASDPTVQGGPAEAAGTTGSSVRLASPAAELHWLGKDDVSRLLGDLGRRQQAQLAALAESSAAVGALRELEPAKLDALLAELDASDRARLLALLVDDGEP